MSVGVLAMNERRMMNDREATHRFLWRGSAALWLAAAALILSTVSMALALRAEDRAYARMLSEVEDCMRPVYKDFNLKYPSSQPQTIGQVISPLFESVRSGESR